MTATATRTSTPTSTPVVSGGCGQPSGYLPIRTAAELVAITNPQGLYFICNDIQLSGSFTPLFGDALFQGVIAGNNAAITGLSISLQTSPLVGFIRMIGRQGVVTGLRFVSPAVTGRGMVGVVAGMSMGNISAISVEGGSVTATNQYAGAIIGANIGGSATELTSTAQISAPGATNATLVGVDLPQ